MMTKQFEVTLIGPSHVDRGYVMGFSHFVAVLYHDFK